MTNAPELTRGILTLSLEQMVKTLGVKPTACQCPRVYSGDIYLISKASSIFFSATIGKS